MVYEIEALPSNIALTEYASLLWLIHNVPEQKSANPRRTAASSNAERILPFEWERALTSTLAFLSKVTGNKEDITAVCVEETSNKHHRVLLATNKARSAGSHANLDRAKEGFDTLFETCSKIREG
jgi:hypothetical protein